MRIRHRRGLSTHLFMKSTFPFDNCRPRWRTDGRPGFCGHGLSCMIKRVISADNVMDTALSAVCGERAPTAGPDCKCHRTRKQGIPHILCTSAELQFRYVRVDFSYYSYQPLSAQRSPPYKLSGQSFCHTVAVHNSRVVPLWQFIAGSAARFSDRTISPLGRGA